MRPRFCRRWRLIPGTALILTASQLGCTDLDGDGYTFPEDCNELDPNTYEGAVEICDHLDQNCDGVADDGLPVQTYYQDLDGDGYGNPAVSEVDCAQPPLFVLNGDDCLDTNPLVNPGMSEICYDGMDNNCDGYHNGCEFEGLVNLADISIRLTGEAPGDQAGISLATGDVDGNGLSDVLVGAYANVNETNVRSGAAYLVISPIIAANTLALANATFEGEFENDLAGFDVSTGDVNGDNYDDIVIGAYGAGTGEDDFSGAAYVVSGPVADGTVSLATATARIIGNIGQSWAGFAVASGCDLNSDSYDDVIIGAPSDITGGLGSGAVYIFFGPLQGDYLMTQANTVYYGEGNAAALGNSVTCAGDVNGDGNADVLMGAPGQQGTAGEQAGAAYVYFGPISPGFSRVSDADVRILGENAFDGAGWSVARAGDVNADGYADLLVGAVLENSDGPGSAYVILGPILESQFDLANADAKWIGEDELGLAGHSVSTAGDVNRDGYDDILIGDIGENTNGIGSGSAYLIYGPPESGVRKLGLEGAKFVGETEYELAGTAISSAGDVNNDGFADFMVSALGNSQAPGIGIVYVILGKGM